MSDYSSLIDFVDNFIALARHAIAKTYDFIVFCHFL
jgi:hypothetical protein